MVSIYSYSSHEGQQGNAYLFQFTSAAQSHNGAESAKIYITDCINVQIENEVGCGQICNCIIHKIVWIANILLKEVLMKSDRNHTSEVTSS